MQEYTVKVCENHTVWFQNGLLHRIDGPAIIWFNGDKEWCQNGKLHRMDGPAVEYADGTKKWYKNGKRHRTDGPAIEWENGEVQYWENGEQIPNPNTKEMTIKEISEQLGFNVKVVK